jgi:hypothetical protein
MTTVADIIDRAFRKIGVASSDEALSAKDQADGLAALNMMLAAWALAGVDIGHTELAATEEFPLDARFHEGSVYMLASRLGPDFTIPPSFDADDFFRKIQAAYLVIDPVPMPLALRRTSSQRRIRF